MRVWRAGRLVGIVAVWLVGTAGGLACTERRACRDGQQVAPTRSARSPSAGHHVHAHAHNDYEHDRPLRDALDQRFYSVEADVWMRGGQLVVSHEPWGSKGTLEELYLRPLQDRVDAQGSVHGDGEGFLLWIDFKDGHPQVPQTLHRLLERYPMLTVFDGATTTPGAVTVVLTGTKQLKERFVKEFTPRRACRDSNDYDPDDPPADTAWRYYGLDWADYVDVRNTSKLDDAQRQRVACIIANAHAGNRTVRFFNAPDDAETWRALLALGVDHINSDKLAELNAALESEP